jgi:hypothetical protein
MTLPLHETPVSLDLKTLSSNPKTLSLLLGRRSLDGKRLLPKLGRRSLDRRRKSLVASPLPLVASTRRLD